MGNADKLLSAFPILSPEDAQRIVAFQFSLLMERYGATEDVNKLFQLWLQRALMESEGWILDRRAHALEFLVI